jgi:CDP-diacylglycerol--serine O-phosphatidyltransferase
VLVSYSPPEVLFAIFLLYGLSGYAMWALRKSKKTPSPN